jgi:hypothetical protein
MNTIAPKIPHKLAVLFDRLVASRMSHGDSRGQAQAYALSTLWKAVKGGVTN